MFKLLGRLAALDARLSRVRINFVPLNLAAALLLVAGVGLGINMVVEGRANPEPKRVTIADIAAGRVAQGSYVFVDGLFDREFVLEIGKKGANGQLSEVKDRLAALIDQAGPSAVLVRMPGLRDSTASGAGLTGMVRALPRAAQEALRRDGADARGRRVDDQLLLAVGQQPASIGLGVLLILVCAPVVGMLAYVHVKRRTIFRAAAGTEAFEHYGTDGAEAADLRVTGRLWLNERTSGRFVEMPAWATALETGEIAFLSNIDASSSFMGVKTADRAGVWAVVIRPGGLHAIVLGALSFGGEIRPAVQFRVASEGGRSQTVTLSFGSVEQRGLVVRELERRCAYSRQAKAA